MNNWNQKKQFAIVEADDFQDRWDRNGLNLLFAWKAKYPKFKITLYTIPNRTSQEFLNLLSPHIGDWIELAVHGWDHESNYECWSWDYDRTRMFMERVMRTYTPSTTPTQRPAYVLNFKAPGWMITGNEKGEGSGYKLQEPSQLAKDNQAVYKALTDMGFIICDRHYNKQFRPENAKIVCIDCNPDIIHFHTWNMETGDPNQQNGFQQIEERFGVPWDEKTEFMFMSEAWEKGKYQKCQ